MTLLSWTSTQCYVAKTWNSMTLYFILTPQITDEYKISQWIKFAWYDVIQPQSTGCTGSTWLHIYTKLIGNDIVRRIERVRYLIICTFEFKRVQYLSRNITCVLGIKICHKISSNLWSVNDVSLNRIGPTLILTETFRRVTLSIFIYEI